MCLLLYNVYTLQYTYLVFMNLFLDWIVGPEEKYNCQNHQVHEALYDESVRVYKEEFC